ncbi:MAG: efflux RND transporter periplasmic adaptor subunit, partial [Pseudomonadota bacterium]
SASSAVKSMADEAHKAAASKHIDPITTGSARSADAFDARGVVVPNAEVTLGAGLAAKIEAMPYKAGQSFRRGDLLVSFDCARQLADLRGAKATMGKAASFYKSKKRLKSRGAAGSQEVREAAADVANAQAAVDGFEEVLRLCEIAAPFNGRVVERHAETHEIPAPNAPIMTVVDDSALELDLIVPSKWLRWVKVGTLFDFNVDELGQNYRARVARMGAKVDAVSQTIKLTGRFVVRPQSVLAGMSGTAKFEAPANLSN